MASGNRRGRPGRWLLGLTAVVVAAVGFGTWRWHSQPAPDLITRGVEAYTRGDWNTASDLARRRLKQEADDPRALRLLARGAARLGRDGSASAVYARLGKEGMEVEDHYLSGRILDRGDLKDLALKAWATALEVDPNHPETLDEVTRLLFRSQRPDEAARAAERLARQPGWQARGLLLLGSIRDEINDPGGAAEAFRRALAHDPAVLSKSHDPARLGKQVARAFLRVAKPDEARPPLEGILAGGPDPEASWLLSRVALQAGETAEVSASLAKAGPYRADHPLEPEPGPYVGAGRCTPCHPATSRAGLGSRHAHTFHSGVELKDLPIPEHPIPDPDNQKVTHTLKRDGDRLVVETHIEDKLFRALIEYAFGTRDRYVTMASRDDKGQYRALRLSHYQSAEGSGWDKTSGDSLPPRVEADYLGRRIDVRDGVVRCLFCHTTNARGGRDRDGPESADRGIGCERCHGPGGNHLAAVGANLDDPAIINPALADSEGITRLCSECHVLGHSEPSTSRADPDWVRSQGVTLTWSRCYTESGGSFTCLTCHDPHHKVETRPVAYVARCLSCHSASADVTEAPPPVPAPASPNLPVAAPRRVACPVSPARDCLNCHMPKVRNAVLHTDLTDHYIRVRDRPDAGK